MREQTMRRHVSFYIEPEVWEAFKHLVKELGFRSPTEVMRNWVYEELLLHDHDVEFTEGYKLSEVYDLPRSEL